MMIRLIFKIHGQTVEKSYAQSVVTIGQESPDLKGLPVDESEWDRDHIRFVDQNGEVYVINQANDPFVTLNGRPFGRKKLSSGDRLEIGELEILYAAPEGASRQKGLSEVLDEKIKAASKSRVETDSDLDHLIAQVEGLESEDEEIDEPQQAPFVIHQNPVPKDVSRELPSRWRLAKEPSSDSNTGEDEVSRHPSMWGTIIAYAAVLLAITAALGSGIYFTFSEQSDAQEFLAAEGLADISMAFAYAHQYQVKPAHQNWSDGDFINETLAKILPEEANSYALIDKQGNFTNADYLLRAYSTPDLSRFLLIAQPYPSVLQWILPRETIVIDSHSMELRRTKDLKELNRLLANPNPLEGANATALFKLVKKAELVRLSTLAQETGHIEFNPPANLSQVRLASASLVYNAPRYYLFGQPLLRALAGGGSQEGEEHRALEDLLRSWHGFSNLVLYAKDNKDLANHAFNVLRERFPHETFLIGYLGPNSETSTILTEPLPYHEPLDPYLYDFQGQEATASLEAPPAVNEEAEQALQRKRELKRLGKQIKQLLDHNTSAPQPDFYEKLNALLQDYKQRDLSLQKKPESELVGMVSIEALASSQKPEEEAPPAESSEAIQTKLQQFSEQIQEAKSLVQLQTVVKEIALWEKNIQESSPTRFAIVNNKLKALSLRRLEILLFSPASPLSPEDLQPRQRVVLQSILNNVNVDDPYQRDYYLKEFDLLVERN